ncbi:MAG: hypothetical protein IT249_05945 [Chitinophagaceae bacterium]|nr:hypothetical protein [Chitinophagaceae bacterium]
MKQKFLLCLGIGAALCTSSAIAQVNPQTQKGQPGDQQQRYLDITTGRPIDLRYNARENTMYDRSTNKPVDFFINKRGDTISSRGFYVVNNYLVRDNDTYRVDTGKVRMRGQKLWGIQSDKELDRDKNWKQYRNVKDSIQR